MTKPRPGVFDPFRQETPPAAGDAEPLDPQSAALDAEEAAATPRRCVTFPGNRYGVNVWVTADGADAEADARMTLGEMVHEMYRNPLLAGQLHREGIRRSAGEGIPVGAGLHTIWVLDAAPSDRLGRVLRRLDASYTYVNPILRKYGVVPFLRG